MKVKRMLDLYRLSKEVKPKLTEKRWRHTRCVQTAAVRLAMRHGADWYKASVAALLHDVCRCMSADAQLKYLKAHAILLDDFTMAHLPIWHAVCAPVYMRRELGIRDREILDAVRYHTTGRADMGLLEKVLFVADAVSGDRDYPGVEELRRLAQESLDEVVRRCLTHTMELLRENGLPVVADTRGAWEFYVKTAGDE